MGTVRDTHSLVAPPAGPGRDAAARALVETAWRDLVDALAHVEAAAAGDGDHEAILVAIRDGVRWELTRTELERAEMVTLSAREREIARMIAKGYTSKTIAAVLGISAWTVDTYVRRVFAKLDVNTRSSMIARLTRGGVLDDAQTPDWAEAWQQASLPGPQ
jgi:DNA-binding CsgD family transcriptional regulator